MKAEVQEKKAGVEVFALIDASIRELVEAIEDDAVIGEEQGPLPPRADQIADLVLDETVRLVRLGGRTETVEAGSELADALIGPQAEALERRHADAFLSLIGASRVLQAASAPSSRGAELSVLRSWKGKALKVLEALHEAPNEELPRAEIRALLGEVKESYMSHLLADMEAARLVARVREGRLVTVHLGQVGRSKRVREMLPRKAPAPSWPNPPGRSFFWQTSAFEKGISFAPLHFIFDPSRLQEAEPRSTPHDYELAMKQEIGEVTWTLVDKQVEAHDRDKEIPALANSQEHAGK